jgi:hypothetical protein
MRKVLRSAWRRIDSEVGSAAIWVGGTAGGGFTIYSLIKLLHPRI